MHDLLFHSTNLDRKKQRNKEKCERLGKLELDGRRFGSCQTFEFHFFIQGSRL